MHDGGLLFADEKQCVGRMKNLATPLGLAGLGSRPQIERSDALSFDWRVAGIALCVFAGYYLGAKVGFALTFHPHPVSVLWPPNSILLAALLLMPKRTWWLMLLAAFAAHWLVQLQSDVPPHMIFCWFISNSCEALIGAGSIRFLIGSPVRLDRLRNVAIFLSLRRFSWAVPVFLFGFGLRRHESLGRRQLLGDLANAIYLQHSRRADGCCH